MKARANDEPAAEWVDIDAIHPWEKNPRKNDGEPVKRVADSIKRFGFAAPIVARKADGEIIAGHTRWKAAKQLKLRKVPVRFVDLEPADAHLLALADNKLNELAEWDEFNLRAVMGDFSLLDLEAIGFDSGELDKLAGSLMSDAPAMMDDQEQTEQSVCPSCGQPMGRADAS